MLTTETLPRDMMITVAWRADEEGEISHEQSVLQYQTIRNFTQQSERAAHLYGTIDGIDSTVAETALRQACGGGAEHASRVTGQSGSHRTVFLRALRRRTLLPGSPCGGPDEQGRPSADVQHVSGIPRAL